MKIFLKRINSINKYQRHMANENYLTYKQKKRPVQFNKKTQIINRKIGKGDI